MVINMELGGNFTGITTFGSDWETKSLLSSESSRNLSSNSSESESFEYIKYPLTFQICVYILYNGVFILAVGGNLLVIYVVVSSARMRTVTNYLIANLALGDLLMALLCVPFAYISVLHQYWPFGLVLCHVVSPAQATCVFVSAYTLIALAIDRYVAILYPLRPRLRRSQAICIIALVWVIALLTAVPTALFTQLVQVDATGGRMLCEESGWENDNLKMGYGYTLLILQYFFPICVLIYTYTRIALEIWGKKKEPTDISSIRFDDYQQSNREQRLNKAKRKTVVMTFSVVAGYSLAWLPWNLFGLYLDTLTFEPDEERLPYLEYIFFACHWLAMAHTTYNPLIYAWLNIKFRTAFISFFNKCFNRKIGYGMPVAPAISVSNQSNSQTQSTQLTKETRLIITRNISTKKS